MSEQPEKEPLLELGGIWQNRDRNGGEYWTGRLGRLRLVIFPNKYKKPGSKEPDAIMYVCKPKVQEGEKGAARGEESQVPPRDDFPF